MKKKTLVILCCLVSSCYAQPQEGESAPRSQPEEKSSCSVVQEALFEDDFFFDMEDEQDSSTENYDEPTGLVSRLQGLVNTLGVQALLGAMYISGVCSDAYHYIQGLLNEKK